MRLDGILGRILALLVVAGCALALVQVRRGAVDADTVPATASAVGRSDCVAARRTEIERLKAAGQLSAEQAMIRRQKAAAECAGGG